MTEPINQPPFNVVEAIKAQPEPANQHWDMVREKNKHYGPYPYSSFTMRSQLAVIMSEDSVLRAIIVNWEDAQLFRAIMSRAFDNWNAVNAANPVQGSLAEVYGEVVSGHQEEAAF